MIAGIGVQEAAHGLGSASTERVETKPCLLAPPTENQPSPAEGQANNRG